MTLITEMKQEVSIKQLCRVTGVPLSTYYRWAKKDFALTADEQKIEACCKENKFTYGILKIANQVGMNHKKVARIMQKYGWNCRVRPKKAKRPGEKHTQVANLLNRDFSATRPLEKLTTDITYLPCGFFLSSIMDLYNREIISFDISDKQDLNFVLKALNRLNLAPGTLLHSDQGSVYTSNDYHDVCTQKGLIRSMSRKGTPADNACIESFHSTLKSETFYLMDEKLTRNKVFKIVSDYILHYNTERIQQKLGYLSPIHFRLAA